jgi:hypothetical protein
MVISEFVKSHFGIILSAIAIPLLVGVIHMITERYIERKAKELMLPLRKEIAKKARLKTIGKGPQIVYNDSINPITFEEGKTPYKFQSFTVYFSEIEKVYHKDKGLKIKILNFYWSGNPLHSGDIHDEIKKRCFKKLLKDGRLRPGRGEGDFIFSMANNLDLLENEPLEPKPVKEIIDAPKRFSGVIESINEDKTITLRMPTDPKLYKEDAISFTVGDTIKIVREGKDIEFSYLKTRMAISIIYKNEGENKIIQYIEIIKDLF